VRFKARSSDVEVFQWNQEGWVSMLALLDSSGSIADVLAFGPAPAQGRLYGVIDRNQDGYSEILVDQRGEYFEEMGSITLIEWKNGKKHENSLAWWGGG